MNIYDLRNCIKVTSFGDHELGAVILYTYRGVHKLTLSINELHKELVAIGSLGDDECPSELVDYNISQWDALNIAIRFELARETEKEIDNADIGKAIDNLIKNE